MTETRPGLGRLTLVELRKLVDTRAGLWLTAITVLSAVVVCTVQLIWGLPEDRSLAGLVSSSVQIVSVLLPVLGILSVTSEWSQRTTLTTFALVPRRVRVIGAKVFAGTVAAVLAVVACLGVAAAAAGIASLSGVDIAWTLRPSLVGYAAVVQVVSVLMGVAFGALLLNSPLAIVLYFLLPTVWSILGGTIAALRRVADWLDTAVTLTALFGPQVAAGDWARVGTSVALWVGLPLALGLARITRSELA